MNLTWTTHTAEYAADLGLTLNDIQSMLTSATSYRERVSGPIYAYTHHGIRATIDTHTCTVLRVEYDLDPDALDDWYFTPRAINDCKHFNTTSTHDTRRTTGGTPTGSIPSTTTELLTRARRAGFGISLAGSGHHKIWASGTPKQGRSVTIPATASDHRSLLNSVMTIRSILGVDLRKY